MSFLSKLFGKQKKQADESTRSIGNELPQSQDQIDNTRANMEAEMAADRERRGPSGEQKPETK